MTVLSPGYTILVQFLQVVLLRLLGGLLLEVDGIEVLHQVWDVIVIVIPSGWPLLVLLDGLVGLGKLTQRSQRVGTKLIEDAGDKLSQFLHLSGSVHGKGIGRNGGVNYRLYSIRSVAYFWDGGGVSNC